MRMWTIWALTGLLACGSKAPECSEGTSDHDGVCLPDGETTVANDDGSSDDEGSDEDRQADEDSSECPRHGPP